MAKELPVGVAQQKVLTALGAPTAIQSWGGAEAYFERIGIRVRAVRVGRSSEPRVRLREDRQAGGGWNEGGDGDSWGERAADLTEAQRAAIAHWWEK